MENQGIVIKGGRVIDPASGLDEVTEVYIDGDQISRVGGRKNFKDRKVIDANGKLVLPGLIDIHVHLREPGREVAETIETGSLAALSGGFTSVCCMANTTPPVDSQEGIRFVYDRARDAACWVYPLAAVTKGMEGKELAEIFDLARAGAVAFSDDGRPVSDSRLLRNAMDYARMLEMVITCHSEDKDLFAGGHMHEGEVSGRLGIPGIPGIAESTAVARNIALSEFTGARLHICHVSTAESVELIRRAKTRGVPVTAEATPHHLVLTDESVADSLFDANFKMNPPLRSAEDVAALRKGIADGTIDAIASDHAPHTPEDKDRDFITAPFGIVGLETSVGLIYDQLVRGGVIDEVRFAELMTSGPAAVYDLPGGNLAVGGFADVTIIDPEHKWTVDPLDFESLSTNTPFANRELTGKAVLTMVAGEILHDEMG